MEKRFPSLAANTVKQRRHHIENLILPKLGGLAAKDITTGDVVALMESVGKNSVNVAELVFTAINEIFKHGIARHVVTTNPCAGITVSAICGSPTPRERLKLSEAELRTILAELPTIGAENALAVKVLLATGVRINELARARWEHVDFDGGARWFQPDGERIDAFGPKWIVPNEHIKTGKKSGRHFVIPLPPTVVQWFRELQILACGSLFVLPARQTRRTLNAGTETFFEQRALNAMLHKLCDRLGEKVRRFTPHDLRSTVRSHMSALGINILVAERILNHSLGGLAGIYDQHDYMAERRAALNVWVDFLVAWESGNERTPAGSDVVLIRATA
jgi:integrase